MQLFNNASEQETGSFETEHPKQTWQVRRPDAKWNGKYEIVLDQVLWVSQEFVFLEHFENHRFGLYSSFRLSQ